MMRIFGAPVVPAVLTGLMALAVFAGPSSFGADAGTTRKPGSYVPHSHTTHHVYGSPISRPILGRAKKRPSSPD